jgi:hypothetical protein
MREEEMRERWKGDGRKRIEEKERGGKEEKGGWVRVR